MGRWWTAVGMLVGVLAGCSGHRATPVRVPLRTGALKVAVVRLDTLDPALAVTPSELEAARALYSPLTTWNPRTLEAEPGLAASWSVSADQRVWTFVLRAGATFSDGRPITAADVRATYERVARRSTNSPSASLLAGIVGYDVMRSTGQSGLAVTDAGGGAVSITTTSPLSVLPSILASPVLGIMPAEVKAPFPDAPVGSGPFRVASRARGVVRLERSPGRFAAAPAMEMVSYADDEAAWRAFRAGDLDWSPVPAEMADAPGVSSRPLQAELFYGFNLKDDAVGNVTFRTAAFHSVDRRRIATGPYQGTALATDRLITPIDGAVCDAMCGLDRSGPRLGQTVSIDYDEDRVQDAVAHELAADLGTVGITARLRAHPLADFQSVAASGTGQLLRLGWVAPYPGPDGELAPLFGTGAPDNLTGFSSPVFDAAIAAARAETDPARREAHYRQAEKVVLDSGVVIPLVEFEAHWATAARVRGLDVDAMGGWDPAKVSVSGSGR